jgi:predicted dehydrogenase
LLQKKLAPVDTVHALLSTKSGASGTFTVSFGTEFKAGFQIHIVTTKGSVTVTPTEVTVTMKDEGGNKLELKKNFAFSAGVKPEIEAFGKSINAGNVDSKQSPENALKDLEILEGMLRSGEKGTILKL